MATSRLETEVLPGLMKHRCLRWDITLLEKSAASAPSPESFQAVIKSAVSAASPKTTIQGSLAISVVCQPSRHPLAPLD